MDVWQPPPTCHGGGWERDIFEKEMMDEMGAVKVEMRGTRGASGGKFERAWEGTSWGSLRVETRLVGWFRSKGEKWQEDFRCGLPGKVALSLTVSHFA